MLIKLHRNSNKKYKQNDPYPRKKHGKCHRQTVSPSCLGLNVLTFTRCSMARNCQHSECNDWVWTDDTQSIVWGIVGSKIISHDHPARPFSNDLSLMWALFIYFFFFFLLKPVFLSIGQPRRYRSPGGLNRTTRRCELVLWVTPSVNQSTDYAPLMISRWVGAGGT